MTEEKPSGLDPGLQHFADKGLVPRTKINSDGAVSEISWEVPTGTPVYHMGFPEALVLITLLIFLLFLVKGVPWG